jgi:F0F1-type ATP synthase assembly protein I
VLVSVSAAVLLGAFVWLLWRYANVRAWHVALCTLFGFYLASSSSGPRIANVLQALARTISTLHL